MFTALLSGWLSGSTDVKIQANAIGNKTDVLKLFKSAYDKKLFEIYDENEKAQKAYEKQEKEKEEIIQNIIEPEILGIEEKHS